ncbi:alpha/beta hydrolase [Dactylosporangium sp. AC04546]|uniref:alpha/beta hydrolase n=1 Tax=Dactylosporangium sp. AC04546 TaxID=2862460 RepID=UPI001EDFF53E|nr:alpha/beta hydrolase [Dactylosporangium sp. AC04546]WVK89645.1 alpha/beta hydrolase [Dactylosporangium sp. AC04546]
MPLDPQVQQMRAGKERDKVAPLYSMSVEAARAADLASIRAAGGNPEKMHEVVEHWLPGPGGKVLLRVYRPSAEPSLPMLMYFFGGGWVLGTIDTADGIARSLANAAGCIVAVTDYRLAPEHPFPAAIEDCWAAAEWVADNAAAIGADPHRVAVGGDGAGGNLAAALTLMAQEAGGPRLAGQLLVCPSTDLSDATATDESMRTSNDPYLFNRHSVAWCRSRYLIDPDDAYNPLASPLQAESLAGLPPALVITAEFDPLRDQGERYAARLARAGVPVAVTRYEGMVHGFFAMSDALDAGKVALAQAAQQLRAWFQG